MRLIDADALIQDIREHSASYFADDFAHEWVDRQPTIEPQRTGKWINCDGSEHWKCDKCGCRAGYWFNEENSSSWELDMSEWLSDFCPNCGARME